MYSGYIHHNTGRFRDFGSFVGVVDPSWVVAEVCVERAMLDCGMLSTVVCE